MSNQDRLLSDEELLTEVLGGSVYDYLPEEYKTQSAIPSELHDEAFDKLKRHRLELLKTQKRLYAEQREANVRHDIVALAPPCEHWLDDKDHEHYCGFINNIWQNWASKNGMTWRPDELRAEQRARIK